MDSSSTIRRERRQQQQRSGSVVGGVEQQQQQQHRRQPSTATTTSTTSASSASSSAASSLTSSPRPLSPESMMLSMSSVRGIAATATAKNHPQHSPPPSPHQQQQQQLLPRNAAEGGINSPRNNNYQNYNPAQPSSNSSSVSAFSASNNQILMMRSSSSFSSSSRRPPVISPPSPSRSWDEGDTRPPSPGCHSWKLQPKPKQQPQKQQLQQRHHQQQKQQPRTVSELVTTFSGNKKNHHRQHSNPNSTTTTNPSSSTSYAFRRVRSSPSSVGGGRVATTSSSNVTSMEDNSSVDSMRGGGITNNERPPTPPTLTNASITEGYYHDDVSSLEDNNAAVVASNIHNTTTTSSSTAARTRHNCGSPNSSVSSTSGGPTAFSLQNICHALQNNGPRPAGLCPEEKALWDAMRGLLRSRNHHPAGLSTDANGLTEVQEQAVLQQQHNHRSLQHIQRLLADAQAERDQAILQLQDYQSTTAAAAGGGSSGMSVASARSTSTNGSTTEEKDEASQQELKVMAARIQSLEQELQERPAPSEPMVRVTVEQDPSDRRATRATIEQLERDKEDLTEKLEQKAKELQASEQSFQELQTSIGNNNRSGDSGDTDSVDTSASVMSTSQDITTKATPTRCSSNNSQQLDTYRKELTEKSAALENAKMIIASLENASGSLAADMKTKLRRREDELARCKRESAEKQRTLDALAMELRELQKVKASPQNRNAEMESTKRLQLSNRLESNLADIRAAAVILESTQDATAVANLSELLVDSIEALKQGIDVLEHGVTSDPRQQRRRFDSDDSSVGSNSKLVKSIEENARWHKEEAARLRAAAEETQRRHDEDVHALQAEIKILRRQCNTNMEVLTRKERELAVLRDSLQAEEVGYISDDDDDATDEGQEQDLPASDAARHISADYTQTQAEALATLLAHGGNRSFDSSGPSPAVAKTKEQVQQVEALKVELSKSRSDFEKGQRALKVEKESLTNAKMIISSLERANKSMMEDLRARLQDSNTAIASLLESNSALRAELDDLKKAQSGEEREQAEEMALMVIPPPPAPLLLTETID